MKTMLALCLRLALVVGPAFLPVSAHPQHEVSGSPLLVGVLHPLQGADHILAMAAVGVWAMLVGGRQRLLMPLAFVVGMLLGFNLPQIGIASMPVDTAVIASVIVLGLACASAVKPPAFWAIALIALFGACHGLAHGMEMPSGQAPGMFALGMLVATALLHVLGLLMATGLYRVHRRIPQLLGAMILAAGMALFSL